jgi:hypothetical protein
MPYSKAQLLAVASERALQVGLLPISESVFESWIQHGLIEGARAHGARRGVNPDWTYGDEVKDTVELIVELKSQGALRNSQLMICLWAFGRNFPFRKIVAALKSELRRIVKQQARGRPWWKVHHDDLSEISEPERARRISQLPLLDTDLAETPFALTRDAALEVLLRAYWGMEDGGGNLFPGLAQIPGLVVGQSDALAVPINISGAIGPPDESATGGYEALDRISEDDLELARGWICLCFGGLVVADAVFSIFPQAASASTALAYQKAASSFLRPDWVVPTAALFSISAFNDRQAGSAPN